MKKVSFDFDSTLDRKDVQIYASELLKKGFEVWICTSRFESSKAPNLVWNDDLFEVADLIGIKREHIIFCNMINKSELLKNQDFIFHIDDDDIELFTIEEDTDVIPIFLTENKRWLLDCEKAISLKNV